MRFRADKDASGGINRVLDDTTNQAWHCTVARAVAPVAEVSMIKRNPVCFLEAVPS